MVRTAMEVPFGRGCLESLSYRDGVLQLSGWLVHLSNVFEGFRLMINGVEYGRIQQVERRDVAAIFPFIPGAHSSGFYLCEPVPANVVDGSRIDVCGVARGQAIVRLSTVVHRDFGDQLPKAPPELMQRVANHSNIEMFQSTGLQAYGEFLDAMTRHGGSTVRRLLDWGCGVGRITAFFLRYAGIPEVYGCDIDRESVRWCSDHLPAGLFTTIDPYPPTPYRESMFDALVGYSVFTHLAEDVQLQWLQELRRILAPRGLALLSIHGPFAARFNGDETALKAIEHRGIYDARLDPALDGVAPHAYYRSVYHHPSYVRSKWGGYFEVLEHISGGMGNYQDLVVLRRSP